MKKSRFAALLLTGKAATLPVLISQARADITPTYRDILSEPGITNALRVVQVPNIPAMRLQSASLDSNYGPSSYAAILCTSDLNANATPASAYFVVTGVNAGETVYLAGASGKNEALNTSIDPRLTIGNTGLKVLGAVTTSSSGSVGGPRMSVSFAVSTSDLVSLAGTGKKAYVQAVSFTTGAPISAWRITELDEIAVGSCSTTQYGTTVY